MSTGVRIEGPKVEREAVEAVADAVKKVFESAAATRMDQETVRAALSLVGALGQGPPSPTSINNCSFKGAM